MGVLMIDNQGILESIYEQVLEDEPNLSHEDAVKLTYQIFWEGE